MIGGFTVSSAHMGTVVTVRIPAAASADTATRELVHRALSWFRRVEACCTRFDPESEVRRLATQAGRPLAVSPILYRLVEFALAVAEETGGAFDPTVGLRMEAMGFRKDHRSGRTASTDLPLDDTVSWRDVHLDPGQGAIALARPLLLDLGAVAKGFAVDLAARELEPLESFVVDAGGDLWLGGRDEAGQPWEVGIRHPGNPGSVLETVRVSDAAVCTSGDYERPGHVVDPRSSQGLPAGLASTTVVAPSAMVADALATAAFVLGPRAGLALLERQRVDGLLLTRSLERLTTRAPGPFAGSEAVARVRAS